MAILVVLGLLMIPVECSVAMGPHTIFVSADAIAALQNDAGASHSGHGMHAAPERAEPETTTSTSTTTSYQDHGPSQPEQAGAPQALVGQASTNTPAPDDETPGLRTINAPARPAGISADAVVALDIPGGQPNLPGPINDGRVQFSFAMPPDRFLTGPEPPPP